MPSKDPRRALLDIKDHIELVKEFTEGFDEQSFVIDKKTVYSVVRCLEIISEASRRLPDAIKAKYPDVPWKKMAGAGNVYRHDYEGVAAIYVWDTVAASLPVLQDMVERELAMPDERE